MFRANELLYVEDGKRSFFRCSAKRGIAVIEMKEVKRVEKIYARGQVFSCFRLYFVAVELYVW